MPTLTDPHFDRLIRLLELEAEAEKQEALQDMQCQSPAEAEASGTTLTNLVIRDEDTGFGGRILLTLGKRNQNLASALDAVRERHAGLAFRRWNQRLAGGSHSTP